jgi:hypothetical protein
METFEIPKFPPNAEEIAGRVAIQASTLAPIYGKLGAEIDSRLTAQGAMLDTVAKRLKNSINQRLRNQGKQVKSALTPLLGEVATRLAAQQSQVDTTAFKILNAGLAVTPTGEVYNVGKAPLPPDAVLPGGVANGNPGGSGSDGGSSGGSAGPLVAGSNGSGPGGSLVGDSAPLASTLVATCALTVTGSTVPVLPDGSYTLTGPLGDGTYRSQILPWPSPIDPDQHVQVGVWCDDQASGAVRIGFFGGGGGSSVETAHNAGPPYTASGHHGPYTELFPEVSGEFSWVMTGCNPCGLPPPPPPPPPPTTKTYDMWVRCRPFGAIAINAASGYSPLELINEGYTRLEAGRPLTDDAAAQAYVTAQTPAWQAACGQSTGNGPPPPPPTNGQCAPTCPPPVINVQPCGAGGGGFQAVGDSNWDKLVDLWTTPKVPNKRSSAIETSPIDWLVPPNWCDPDSAERNSKLKAEVNRSMQNFLLDIFGGIDPVTGERRDGIWGYLTDALPFPLNAILWVLGAGVAPDIPAIRELFKNVVGCSIPLATPGFVGRMILDFLHKWFGLGLGDTVRRYDLWLNALCPIEPPTASQADDLWLRGKISDGAWQGLVSAANICPEPRKAVRDAGRTRPSLSDVFRLHWRNEIADPKELGERVHFDKVTDARDYDLLEKIHAFYPTPQQVESWFSAGAFADDAAFRWGLDEGDPENWPDPAGQARKADGAPDWARKARWRAHWRLPGTGEAIAAWFRFGGAGAPGDPVMTDADLQFIFRANDVPPFWRRIAVELARPKLRIGQVQRLYVLGGMQDESARQYLLQLGYAPGAADALIPLWRDLRLTALLKAPLAKRFLAGHVDSGALAPAYVADGVLPEVASQIALTLIQARNDKLTDKCAAGYKRRFLRGEFDGIVARQLLLSRNYPIGAADFMVQEWECERTARGKQVGASALCRYVTRGLITPSEMKIRLIRLGYSGPDADLIVAECAAEQMDRQAKATAGAQRRAAADALKQQAASARAKKAQETANARAAQAAARKAAASAKLIAQALKKAEQNAAKVKATYEKFAEQLSAMVAKLAQTTGADPSVVAPVVNGLLAATETAVKVSPLTAVKMLHSIVHGKLPASLDDLVSEWLAELAALPLAPL